MGVSFVVDHGAMGVSVSEVGFAMRRAMQNQIDCLVLSGGGAKGAFGAGAGKPLQRFLNHWNAQPGDGSSERPQRGFCYIGTSAGALNACVLAAFGANKLIEFWEVIQQNGAAT